MKKRSLFLLLCLIAIAGLIALAFSGRWRERTYTVQEVLAGLRSHPSDWVGRTVTVKGYLMEINGLCASSACPKVSQWAWTSQSPQVTAWEELRSDHNNFAANSILILRRFVPLSPSPQPNRLHSLIARIPGIGATLADIVSPLPTPVPTPHWGSRATYRIVLLSGAPCMSSKLYTPYMNCGPQGVRS